MDAVRRQSEGTAHEAAEQFDVEHPTRHEGFGQGRFQRQRAPEQLETALGVVHSKPQHQADRSCKRSPEIMPDLAALDLTSKQTNA